MVIKMVLIGLIGEVLFRLVSVIIIVGNILEIIMLIKNLANKVHHDKICHLNVFCHRYWADVTQEDVDCLTKMLNERRKELDDNDG